MSRDIEARLNVIVATELQVPLDRIAPGVSLRKELGMDSVAAVNIIFAVEDEFGVHVPEKELENIDTIDAILVLLRNLLESAESPPAATPKHDTPRSERAN